MSELREWNVWPPEEKQNVLVAPSAGRDGSAGLRVQVKAPSDGNWPDFHIFHDADLPLVEGHRYRVRCALDRRSSVALQVLH